MRKLVAAGVCAVAVAGWIPAQAQTLQSVQLDALCVTNGTVTALPGGRLAINTPSSRAVVRTSTASRAEIRFRYLGPSEGSKPLASGEMRRQIGLKLRALDQCNLLYVMWHIEPDSRVAVSIKRNPGMYTHEQCGANGYINLRPPTKVTVPPIRPGEAHVLRAALQGDALTVYADGTVAWAGQVGNGVADIDGPVGFRTDNARFEFEFFADVTAGDRSQSVNEERNRCAQSPGD
jgi:hypothetical protein